MTSTSEHSKNLLDKLAEIKEEDRIYIDTAKPLETKIIEVNHMGYRGAMDIEYNFIGHDIIIKTRRYLFGSSLREKNQKFKITPILIIGPELSVTPIKDNQWHQWDSSATYTGINGGFMIKCSFIFGEDSNGLIIGTSKSLILL